MDCCGSPLHCIVSPEVREKRKIHKRIEMELRRSRRDLRKEVKLLLLGIGESGKSTIIRQMRIINNHEFSESERREYRIIIHQNLIMAMQTLAEQMTKMGIAYKDRRSEIYARNISQIDYRTDSRIRTLDDQLMEWLDEIEKLWADEGIKECYNRRREYNLTDSAKYYLDRINIIKDKDFLPENEDIVHVRHPTTGINEYPIEVNDIRFRIVDVGGQRSERRKWIHCFENVTSIIYVVALSEYDHVSQRERDHIAQNDSIPISNRIEESRALFKVIIDDDLFRKTSFILFMNKKDILEEKIVQERINLQDFFPEYAGPPRDHIMAREFLLGKFVEVTPDRTRHIYPHHTCATDTENMRFVFEAVKDTILALNLREFCLA